MTFSLMRVMERARKLMEKQFLLLFLFAVCVIALLQAASNFFSAQFFSYESIRLDYIAWPEFLLNFGVIFIIGIVVGNALYAALTFALAKNFGGHKTEFGEMLQKGLRHIWPLFLISLLIIGIAILLALVNAGLMALLQAIGLPPLLAIAAPVAVGVFLFVRWAVLLPVQVIEQTGVLAAFSRSAQLTQGKRLPIFGFFVLVFILVLVFSFAVNFILGLIFTASLSSFEAFPAATSLFGPSPLFFVLNVLVSAVFTVASMAVAVSLYLELCCLDQKASSQELAAKLNSYYTQNPQG